MSDDAKLKYELHDCCKRSLRDIAQIKELGKVLHGVLAASPFVVLFGSGPIETTFSIGTQDWKLWAESVKTVPAIVKNRCQQVAGFEVLNHPGGPLHQFWRKLYDSFQ
jgi:hypothetical protein